MEGDQGVTGLPPACLSTPREEEMVEMPGSGNAAAREQARDPGTGAGEPGPSTTSGSGSGTNNDAGSGVLDLFFVLVHLGFWGQMGVMVRFWITTALEAFCKSDVSGKRYVCASDGEGHMDLVVAISNLGAFLPKRVIALTHRCSEDCWSEDGTIREFVGTMLCNMIGSFLMGFLTVILL